VSGDARLPKWVTSNAESVWRETERSRQQTPAERWRDVVAACDTLRIYWTIPGYAERVMNAADPLPESSKQALARLREEFRRSRGGGR
jgi:hypothetical protein